MTTILKKKKFLSPYRSYSAFIEIPEAQTMEFKSSHRASLVVQWLRIRLPMQGTRVRALVWEDPTCRRATKPVRHNY